MPVGDDIHMWMEVTRSYLIGRNPVLDPILKWVEAHGEASVKKKKTAKLRDELSLMTDLEPTIASEQMWSFLNMNTTGTQFRETFMNVERLNGFEAWRKITEPIRSTSVAMRIAFRKNAWNPAPAKTIQDYAVKLEKWETDYRKYIEVGGERISDEQRRELLIGILPPDLSVAMMIETHKHGNYHKLKLFMKNHVQLLKDHSSRIAVKGGVNVLHKEEEYEERPTDKYGTEPGGDEVCDVECDKDAEELIEINA